MTLYRVASNKLEPIQQTSFATENLLERKDLQRLLKADITPLGDDLLVIAEEFGDWEDSNRRIDLLCLSNDGGLVVVEIKRTVDGGHMELQAIRYAAMVSSMTLEQAIQAYAKARGLPPETAETDVLEFLQVDSQEETELTGEVRIILVSADFSTELTTAVLWLNRHDLDIICIRLRPYRIGNEVFVDATQIVPLPETADYEVKVRAQEKEKRKVVGVRQDILRRFWTQFIERSKAQTSLFANRTPGTDHWLAAGIGRAGFTLNAILTKHEGQVECYIRVAGDESEKRAYHALLAQRAEIEAQFGGPLDWQELPSRNGSRICTTLPGGWQSAESEWPDMQLRMVDAAVRLEQALRNPVQALKV